MNPSELRKQQIAKQLGVSVHVLEQYLQVKRAEVSAHDRSDEQAAPRRHRGRVPVGRWPKSTSSDGG